MMQIAEQEDATNTTAKKNYLCHHRHISVMELGHLLTRSGITYPEASSKVYHIDDFISF